MDWILRTLYLSISCFFLCVKCNVKGLYISSLCNHIPIVYSPLLLYVSVKEAACICCQTCTTYLLRELYIPPYICLLFKCIVFLRIQNSFWETIKRSCQSLSICLHGNQSTNHGICVKLFLHKRTFLLLYCHFYTSLSTAHPLCSVSERVSRSQPVPCLTTLHNISLNNQKIGLLLQALLLCVLYQPLF